MFPVFNGAGIKFRMSIFKAIFYSASRVWSEFRKLNEFKIMLMAATNTQRDRLQSLKPLLTENTNQITLLSHTNQRNAHITTNLNDTICAPPTYLWLQVAVLQAPGWMTSQVMQVVRLKHCWHFREKCCLLEHWPGYASVKNNHYLFDAAALVLRRSSHPSWMSCISFSCSIM